MTERSQIRKAVRIGGVVLIAGACILFFQNCSPIGSASHSPILNSSSTPLPGPSPSPAPFPSTSPTPSPSPGVFSWKTLKVGAGGFLSGMDVAPDGTKVVRTDTYGAYLLVGSQWTQLLTTLSMPAADIVAGLGGGVYELRVAPSNSSIFYMNFNGFIYRSTNQGVLWTKTAFAQVTVNANDGYRGNGEKMAVDPANPNVVVVGTASNGLFMTSDGGATWRSFPGIPLSTANGAGITGIAFDSSGGKTSAGNTKNIYASSAGNGVYKSIDGGTTWGLVAGGPTDVENGVVSGGGYYVTAGGSSTLYRYLNGTWSSLLTNSGNVHSIAINPLNASQMAVQSGAGPVNYSTSGGTSWLGWDNSIQLAATDVPWLATTGTWMTTSNLIFDPVTAGKLWSPAGVGVWNTTLPANFPNAAVVWNSTSAGIEQLVADEIISPPGGKPIAAVWDQGIFTINNPATYPSNHFPGQGIFSAGWSADYASSNPNYIAVISDWTMFNPTEQSGFSTDGGQTWQHFASFPPGLGLQSGAMGGSIAASTPQNIIWSPGGAAFGSGVHPYYTINGGASWTAVSLPGITDWSTYQQAYFLRQRGVTADRVTAGTFYLYFGGHGVFKTTNGGVSWTQVFSGPLSSGDIYNAKIEAVPGNAGHLFFSAGQGQLTSFMRSTNGGSSWAAVPNVTQVYCFGYGAPKVVGGYPAIYIVGFVNNVYGVWQSDDQGQTWAQLGPYPGNSSDGIMTMTGDPNTYGVVYIGFSGSGFAYYGP